MKFQFDKKIKSEFSKREKIEINKEKIIEGIKKEIYTKDANPSNPLLSYLLPIPFILICFGLILYTLLNLQVFSYEKYSNRSDLNQFEISEIKPNRGLIVDRNGKSLALNVPAVSIYLSIDNFRNDDLSIDKEGLSESTHYLETILGDQWRKDNNDGFSSLYDKVISIWDNYSVSDKAWVRKIEILSGLGNDISVRIKGDSKLNNIYSVEDGSKRSYPFKEVMSHILGYTGDVYFEDLKELSYVSFNDVVGKTGLEKVYDEELFGKKGEIAKERDVNGKVRLTQAQSGATLKLSIDYKSQQYLYNTLQAGVKRYGAKGGAAIIEDVSNGEILAMVSYPSFNDNLFVDGISQKQYDKILKSGSNPFLNRAISAQVPPGSTFKTIVASAALDAKAITKDTVYISKRGYTFSNGKVFQEYGNNAYGPLNLIDAISKSSNIYFCEVIRHWDMNKLVPYLDAFGIGKITNIDLIGEGSGRLPSPKNKIELAKTSSPWLEAVWYPEGDSCNSVIGQGITTVTPIQMVNWISAIANGGVLNTPHLGVSLEYPEGEKKLLEWKPLNSKIAKDSALSLVREGMWGSVNGPLRVIHPLTGATPTVAAKTGTAEFGKVDSKGNYEHTHAWVTGFFPYSKPKYAFVVFLEDGGLSNNSAQIARTFIDWFSKQK